MKQFSFKSLLILLTIITFGLTSCGESEIEKEIKPVTPGNNEYVIDGTKTAIGLTYFGEYFGYRMAFITPEKNIEKWQEVIDNHLPYLSISVDPSLIGKEFNLMDELDNCYLKGYLPEISKDVFELTSESNLAGIKSGKVTYKIDENNAANIAVVLETNNGHKLEVTASGTFIVPDVKNTMAKGETSEIIKSAFDNSDEDVCLLYFTPQAAEYGEQVEDCKTYALIYLDNALVGKEIDITNVNGTVSFFYSNEFGEDTFSAQSGSTYGTTGTISVMPKEGVERGYKVKVNLTSLSGTKYAIEYDGQCAPFAKPQANEFTIQGTKKFDLKSVVIDQTAAVWTLWLTDAENITTIAAMKAAANKISLTIPATCFNNEPWGFSRNENISIVYNEVTYGLGKEDDRGTIVASMTGTNLTLSFKEWNTPFQGYYNGPVTIVK